MRYTMGHGVSRVTEEIQDAGADRSEERAPAPHAYEFGSWRPIAMATVPVKRTGSTVRKPVKKGG